MKKTLQAPGSRRMFLKFLAGSPLLACPELSALSIEKLLASSIQSPDSDWQLQDTALQEILEKIITTPDEPLNVFNFQPVAKDNLPNAHYGYIATGTDDNATIRANREGFKQYRLRARRLIDVGDVDMSIDLFGTRWETPIVIAPAGSQEVFHDERELAVARAAREKKLDHP